MRLCEELGVCTPEVRAALKDFEEAGQTVVILASERDVLGVLAIADRIRGEAPDAIRSLRVLGIPKTLMLTGDNEGTARAVATHSPLMSSVQISFPKRRSPLFRRSRSQANVWCLSGDGNDAPALAAASVGVAMGAAGTDVALETADIALMADDLSKLPVAMRFSRRTLRMIKQNIAFSLVNKALFIVLGVGRMGNLVDGSGFGHGRFAGRHLERLTRASRRAGSRLDR